MWDLKESKIEKKQENNQGGKIRDKEQNPTSTKKNLPIFTKKRRNKTSKTKTTHTRESNIMKNKKEEKQENNHH